MPTNNINEKVIAIQHADGIDVGPDWWEVNVTNNPDNDGTEETMLNCFILAYERDFPRDADGVRHNGSDGDQSNKNGD